MVPRRLVPNWPDRVDRELAIGAYHASQVGGNSAKAKRKRAKFNPAAEYKGDADVADFVALEGYADLYDPDALDEHIGAYPSVAFQEPLAAAKAEEAAPADVFADLGARRRRWTLGLRRQPAPAPPPRQAPAPPRPPAPAAPPRGRTGRAAAWRGDASGAGGAGGGDRAAGRRQKTTRRWKAFWGSMVE
ncbi:hypothetical protein JL720_9868 [Aureococcus anophagefferens]|nr:hypothetical protein JL720_9868 [Aureococcus anophagefferens]